jgi:hypothetical protein
MHGPTKLAKSHRGIYKIAQNALARLHVTGEKCFNRLLQQRLPKRGIALYS